MRGYNNIQLIGNLGNEPQLRFTASGAPMCTASLAVNGAARDSSGERQESVEWFRLVFFDREAETASRFGTKGGSIFITGQLQTRPYSDRNGVVRTAVEVVVQYFQLLSGHVEHEPQTVRYDSDNDLPPGRVLPQRAPLERAQGYYDVRIGDNGPLEATDLPPTAAPRQRSRRTTRAKQ